MNRHRYPEFYMKRAYHKTYFEGWYYKQVDVTRTHTISFIPSVSFTRGERSAFLQVIYHNGDHLITDIVKCDISKFSAASDRFFVTLDKSTFSDRALSINFGGETLIIEGKIDFSGFTRLNYSVLNPNIMGFFSYMPFLTCKHGVLSMNHSLSGTLNINGQAISFDDGLGYVEKDWGSSFPEKYIWIQCNHFSTANTSLFFSFASTPILFMKLSGFVCNLLFENKQYRFATYTGAKLDFKNEHDKVEIALKDKNYILKIVAFSKASTELFAPFNGAMSRKIKESLKGNIKIALINKKTNQMIYCDESSHVSIEMEK